MILNLIISILHYKYIIELNKLCLSDCKNGYIFLQNWTSMNNIATQVHLSPVGTHNITNIRRDLIN